MRFNRSRFYSIVAAGCAASAALLITPAAQADFTFTIDVEGPGGIGVYSDSQIVPGVPVFGNLSSYSVAPILENEFLFNTTGFTGATSPGFFDAGIGGGFNFENFTSDSLFVTITLTLDTDFGDAPGLYDWTTSVTAGATASSTISTVGPDALWTVLFDGSPVSALFGDPTVIGLPPQNAVDAGSALSPSTITIQIVFEVSPNSGLVTFNGNVAIVPAPGAFALLALGGLVGVSRRRRS